MSDKVTFSQLVEELAAQTDSSQTLSHDFVSSLTDMVVSTAIESGKASITNFGSFTVVDVAARNGVNPQTGESIVIPAHQRLSFCPYKALENTVNAPFSGLEATIIEEESDSQNTPIKETPKAEPVSLKEPDEEEEPQETLPEDAERAEEKEKKPEAPVFKRPGKQQEKAGNVQNILLIIVVLLMVVVALWFFVFRDTSEPMVAEQAPPPVEVPADPTPNPPPAADQTATETEVPQEPEVQEEESPDIALEEVIHGNYVVSPGEWIYDIARKEYTKPTFWPLIFEANFTVSQDPDLITPGKTLVLPIIENPRNLTPEDRTRLAAAHRVVSEAYANAGNQEQAQNYARMAARFSN
ncbi:MAG: HU family DNA-binding protein [Balneola sp.]